MAAKEFVTLPPLPWAPTALQPYVSERTLSFHHGKHHAAYVKKTNELVAQMDTSNLTLENLILESHKGTNKPLFNNSAQVWNHTFFWNSMKPHGGGAPDEKSQIGQKIKEDLGGYEEFKKSFANTATTQFGSGWAWLVLEKGKLRVVPSHDAENPLVFGQTPLLTIDVWEHAYYLDYQNARPDFINAFLTNLVNWDFAESRLNSNYNS